MSVPVTTPPRSPQGSGTISPRLAGTPSLHWNAGWTLVGNSVYAACQWGMLVVIAKFTTAESVGQFALGLATTAPIVMLANLQLRAIQSTDTSERYAFGQYLRLRLATTALALVVITAMALVYGYTPETTYIILAVGVLKAVESISDILYGRMQQREEMHLVARSMVLRGIGALALLLTILLLSGRLVVGIGAMTLWWAAVLILHDASSVQSEPSVFPLSHRPLPLRSLIHAAAPLGVVMLLISLNVNIPRYFLQAYRDGRSLGIFAAIASPLAVGLLVVSALGQSASPRLARLAHERDWVRFRRLLFQLIACGTMLGILGFLIALIGAEPILRIAFSAEYAAYAPVFVWLAVAAGLSYVASFLGYAMTALQQFTIQLPLFLMVSATVTLGAWYWVPRYGLLGAAFATVAAALVQLIGAGLILARGLDCRVHQSNGG